MMSRRQIKILPKFLSLFFIRCFQTLFGEIVTAIYFRQTDAAINLRLETFFSLFTKSSFVIGRCLKHCLATIEWLRDVIHLLCRRDIISFHELFIRHNLVTISLVIFRHVFDFVQALKCLARLHLQILRTRFNGMNPPCEVKVLIADNHQQQNRDDNECDSQTHVTVTIV
jgi:hypothetical protein